MAEGKTIFFWQNIISIHQEYFLNYLSEKYEVVLIVSTDISSKRANQGWNVPNLPKVKVLFRNNINEINELLIEKINAIHCVSGLRHFFWDSVYTKYSNSEIFLMAESPMQIGIKKYIRFFLYKLYFYKYKSKISKVFAIGNLGVKWYKSLGFKNVVPFQYVIDSKMDYFPENCREYVVTNFVYIGELIDKKGVNILLKSLSKIKDQNWKLFLIGSGKSKDLYKNFVASGEIESKIFFLGNIANKDVKLFLLEKADYLILPSRFDGWGVVVSEALSVGVRTIVSDKTGAAIMVKNKDYGFIHKDGDVKNLAEILCQAIDSKDYNHQELARKYAESYTFRVVEKFIQDINLK